MAVIVAALVVEGDIAPDDAAFDLQMLIDTQGKERTRSEGERLLAGGGFSIRELVDVRTFAKCDLPHIMGRGGGT